jgi:uncharacterized protein YggU (UPF0235/DUF167 family)
MRLFTVQVKPGSRSPSVRADGERVVVAVREPAREGKANDAVRRALADYLNVPISRVHLVRGAAARTKIFSIDD